MPCVEGSGPFYIVFYDRGKIKDTAHMALADNQQAKHRREPKMASDSDDGQAGNWPKRCCANTQDEDESPANYFIRTYGVSYIL